MNSAPILPSHLRRKAVIYIRQSTGHQVMTNQESQRMQRDMKEHALRARLAGVPHRDCGSGHGDFRAEYCRSDGLQEPAVRAGRWAR
jgi:hypothetical protein